MSTSTSAAGERLSNHLELETAAPDQQSIIANLIELYAHDFSEFYPLELGEDGRFGYLHLPLYWQEIDRHPFLIRIDGRLAGFALVKRDSSTSGDQAAWDVAEFFIVRAYRRQGVGIRAAHEVWRRYPGPWQVRVMQSNRTGLLFWQRAVDAYSGQLVQPSVIEKDGQCWSVFSFESKPVE